MRISCVVAPLPGLWVTSKNTPIKTTNPRPIQGSMFDQFSDPFLLDCLHYFFIISLSIAYALMAFQRGNSSQGIALMKKALRTLSPIKRQIMLQKSNSPFWTNLKLSILNNYIWILRECGTLDVKPTVMAMVELLARSRSHLDPIDVKKFYLSIQFMDVTTCMAAAA